MEKVLTVVLRYGTGQWRDILNKVGTQVEQVMKETQEVSDTE